MTWVLTGLGAVLILAGLVLLFGRARDTASGETRLKWKDVEIASARPSIVLVCLGVGLVVLPHVAQRSRPTPPALQPLVPGIPTTPVAQELGTRCCVAQGAVPMLAPDVVGAPCWAADVMGNMAVGAVCK